MSVEFGDTSAIWEGTDENTSKVLGVRRGQKNEVVITTECEIRTISCTTRQTIKNWSYLQNSTTKMNIPSCRNTSTGAFFAGYNSRKSSKLYAWNADLLNLMDAESIELQGAGGIFAIHSLNKLSTGPLVVMADGSVSVYNAALKSVFNRAAESAQNVLWSDVAVFCHTHHLVVLVERKQKYFVQVYELKTLQDQQFDQSAKIFTEFYMSKRSDPVPPTTVQSCTFDSSNLILSVFWSNGDWQAVQFSVCKQGKVRIQNERAVCGINVHNNNNNNNSNAGNGTRSMPAKHTPKKRKVARTNSSSFRAAAIPDTSLVIVGKASQAAAAATLSGWDATFGIPVQCITLESESSPMGSLGSVVDVLHVGGNNSIVAFEHAVFLVHVDAAPSNLAASLGKLKAHTDLVQNAALGVCSSAATAVPSLKAALSFKDGEIEEKAWENGSQCNSKGAEVLKELQKTKTKTAAKSTAKSLVAYLQTDEFKTAPSPVLVREGVDFCLKYSMWSALELVVESARLSCREHSRVLPAAMKHNQLAIVEKCLALALDVSESSVVLVLRYLMSLVDRDVLESYTSESTSETSNQLFTRLALQPAEKLMYAALSRPTSDVFLQRPVQALQLHEVTCLLTVLLKCYYVNMISLTEDMKRELGVVPSLTDTLKWITVLLNVHFSALVSAGAKSGEENSPVRMLLEKFRTVVTHHLDTGAAMGAVRGKVGQLLSRTSFPAVDVPDYSISSMQF